MFTQLSHQLLTDSGMLCIYMPPVTKCDASPASPPGPVPAFSERRPSFYTVDRSREHWVRWVPDVNGD